MIRTAEHHNSDAVFLFQLIEHTPGVAANTGFVFFQLLKADLYGTLILLFRKTEHKTEALKHLFSKQLAVAEVDNRAEVFDAVLRKHIRLLGKGCFNGGWCRGYRRTCIRSSEF